MAHFLRTPRLLLCVLLAAVCLLQFTSVSSSRPPRKCWYIKADHVSEADLPSECSHDMCRCIASTVDCSSNFGNLSYIPRLKGAGAATVLNFSSNALGAVHNPQFFINASRNTSVVDLYNNGLTRLPFGVFRAVYKLKRLLIGGNQLPYDALASVLDAPRLESLELKCGGLHDIPDGFFGNQSCSRLRYIDMSWNQLEVLDMKVFQPLTRLRTLILRDNKIAVVKPAFHPGLRVAILQKNRLSDFPQTCTENGSSLFPNVTLLDLLSNYISDISGPVCLPSLITLNLKYNRFSYFYSDMFGLTRFPVLRDIYLNQMGAKIEAVEAYAFNNTNLNVIEFSFNHVDFSSESVHKDIFLGCDHLEKINLDGTNFEAVSSVQFGRLFNGLSTLKFLKLGKTRLHVKVDTFQSLPSLDRLYLYRNEMTEIIEGSFDHFANLTVLKLGSNQITTISPAVFSDDTRSRLQEIDLSGNPFDCSCAIVEFQRWMASQPQIFVDFKGAEYKCKGPDNTTYTLRDSFIPEQACLLEQSTSICIITLCIVFIVLLLATMWIYARRWHIHFALLNFQHPRGQLNKEGRQYAYDVFVAYEQGDGPFVRRVLLPTLEREWGLRVCIHERDFTPGRLIFDNAVKSIDESRSAIAVLSSGFGQSGWCEWELNYCFAEGLMLVPVVLPDLRPQHTTTTMKLVMATITYLKWPARDQDRNVFWKDLRKAMRGVMKKYN